MLELIYFETIDDLARLTGLTRDELWGAGFSLDDFDFGVRVNQKIHREPTYEELEKEDYYEDELVTDWDMPGYRIFEWLQNVNTGPRYVEHKGWHYYMMHHA